MKRYFSIFLLLFMASGAFSQVFPVRTITTMAAPYPVSLEQFASIDDGRVSLTIVPVDVSLHDYPVKLRLVISGGWFKIYTDPDFIHKSIILNSGEPLVFTGPELAEWFNVDNLIFEGLSKNQYLKTGRLPEGVCQVWFETYDYYRNFNISGATKAMMWMFENDPPFLNFPVNKKEFPFIDPQNIVFNWTFRQSPFSGSGASNMYRFELWEVWPDDLNPEEVVRTTRPVYTTELSTGTFAYTSEHPVLLTGRKYVWRVQVFDPEGKNRYKNNGYSETRWFRFGKICGVPQPLLNKTTVSSISVKWEGDYTFGKYELRYRNKNSKDANWYTKDGEGLGAVIDNLQPNTEYEIQLRGFCDMQEGEYSSSLVVRTKQDVSFKCGDAPGNSVSANSDPLPALKPGDVIHASDFDVQIYKVTGANGNFSGKGLIQVPMFKLIKFEVEFSDIQVNTDYRMTKGEINFIYDVSKGLVADLGRWDWLDKQLTPDQTKPVEDNPYIDIADRKDKIDTTIVGVTVKASGDIEVNTTDGRKKTIRGGKDEMVAIEGGTPASEQYVVDTKTGTLYKGKPDTKATSGGGNAPIQPTSGNKPAKFTVTFAPHELQSYGLDLYNDKAPIDNYDKTTVGGQEYIVPWKSVETGRIDRLSAGVSGGVMDSIRFMTGNGNLVMTAPGNSKTTAQVLVTGIDKKDELKAWYGEKVNDSTENRILAGEVNVAAYDKFTGDVCLVQVNGAPTPDFPNNVEEELNEIFKQSVVQWNVVQKINLNINYDLNGNSKLDNECNDEQMNYNDEMKKIIDAAKELRDYKKDVYYIFFVDKFTDASVEGYMPFNRQFGFFYKNRQDPVKLIHDVAHELGHGAFRLRHTFSAENQYVQPQGTTDNLMDYAEGTVLRKYQWSEMREWHLGLNLFEEGQEAASMEGEDPLNNKFILVVIDKENHKLYYCSESDFDLPEVLINKLKEYYDKIIEKDVVIEVIKNCSSTETKKAYIQYKRIYKNSTGYIFSKTDGYSFKWLLNDEEKEIDLTRPYEFTGASNKLLLKCKGANAVDYSNLAEFTISNTVTKKEEEKQQENIEEQVIETKITGIINTEISGTDNWKYIEQAKKIVAITNAVMYQDLLNSGYNIEVSVGTFDNENTKGECLAIMDPKKITGITDIIKDDRGFYKDCQLLGWLSGEEQEILREAILKKDRNIYASLRSKIQEVDILRIDQTIDNRIDPANSSQVENKKDYDKLLQELKVSQIKRYYTENEAKSIVLVDKTIKIKLTLTKLFEYYSQEKDFSIKLAHELGHAWFSIFESAKAWKWNPPYLGVKYPPNGKGHDINNPNGENAIRMQTQCENGYNNALKELKNK